MRAKPYSMNVHRKHFRDLGVTKYPSETDVCVCVCVCSSFEPSANILIRHKPNIFICVYISIYMYNMCNCIYLHIHK